MDDIKTNAAKHHDEAAHHFETATTMHRNAAKQCMFGNFEKAKSLAISASEASTLADRHAVDAVDLYRHHADEVAEHKAELVAEEAARVAKHEAKAAKA